MEGSLRGPCPVQPDGLARAGSARPVDIVVDHHADHRIAAGDRMVGAENDRKTIRRHLDRPSGGAFARQLAVRIAVSIGVPASRMPTRSLRLVTASSVCTRASGSVNQSSRGPGTTDRSSRRPLDRGHRRLVQLGVFVGVVADRQHVAGLQRPRPDRRHHVVAARAQHRCRRRCRRGPPGSSAGRSAASPARSPRRRGRSEYCWCRTEFRSPRDRCRRRSPRWRRPLRAPVRRTRRTSPRRWRGRRGWPPAGWPACVTDGPPHPSASRPGAPCRGGRGPRPGPAARCAESPVWSWHASPTPP